MPRALRWSQGGGYFLTSEVILCIDMCSKVQLLVGPGEGARLGGLNVRVVPGEGGRLGLNHGSGFRGLSLRIWRLGCEFFLEVFGCGIKC